MTSLWVKCENQQLQSCCVRGVTRTVLANVTQTEIQKVLNQKRMKSKKDGVGEKKMGENVNISKSGVHAEVWQTKP